MDSFDVIQKVRECRMQRHLTHRIVAERMGVSSSFVQALEYRRGVDRRWNTIMAYAEAVGVQVNVEVVAPTAEQ